MRENTKEKYKNQAFGMKKHHRGSCRYCSWVKTPSLSLLLEGDPPSHRRCHWSKHCLRCHIPPSSTTSVKNGRVSTFLETKMENHVNGGTQKLNQSRNKPLKLLDNDFSYAHHENKKKVNPFV